MINVDISNLWTCISLPELLGSEQDIFNAHNILRDNQPDGPDFHSWLGLPDSVTGRLVHSIRRVADQIRSDSGILVVCGTGSIWRGARAAVELWSSGQPQSAWVLFAGDSLSGRQWLELTTLVETNDFSLLIISDDGLGIGPNVTARGLRWIMERKYGSKAKERISVATVVGSPLHRMGQEEGYELFPLPRQLGGSSSVLTAAALIPMAVAGLDPIDVLEGAREAWTETDIRSFENPAWLYAAARHVLRSKGRTRELMCITDRSLSSFCDWWRYHAWKHERSLFPDTVLLPEGLRPLDRLAADRAAILETVLYFDPTGQRIPVEMDWKDYDGLGFLSGKTLDFVETELRSALIEQHNELGVPIVEIQCGQLTGQTLGQLFCLFELSSALTAVLAGDDPFRPVPAASLEAALARMGGM